MRNREREREGEGALMQRRKAVNIGVCILLEAEENGRQIDSSRQGAMPKK